MNNKKSYVYKITCKITGEFYFGSSFVAKRDSYWGSGRKIKDRIAKYGKENFVKEILGEFDDRVEAHKKENHYIEQFIHDEKCLNKQLDNHFETFSDETRAKIGAANIGKHRTDETRAKMSAAKLGENHPMYGKHLSKEHRAKLSASHRGEKNPMYGKILSEETRAKMSAAQRGEKNHNFGKHFSKEHRARISAAKRGKPQQHRKHWRKNPVTGKREWYD